MAFKNWTKLEHCGGDNCTAYKILKTVLGKNLYIISMQIDITLLGHLAIYQISAMMIVILPEIKTKNDSTYILQTLN